MPTRTRTRDVLPAAAPRERPPALTPHSWRPPRPVLLAEHARGVGQIGICALGHDIIHPGERIATTPDGRVGHVPCIVWATW